VTVIGVIIAQNKRKTLHDDAGSCEASQKTCLVAERRVVVVVKCQIYKTVE